MKSFPGHILILAIIVGILAALFGETYTAFLTRIGFFFFGAIPILIIGALVVFIAKQNNLCCYDRCCTDKENGKKKSRCWAWCCCPKNWCKESDCCKEKDCCQKEKASTCTSKKSDLKKTCS